MIGLRTDTYRKSSKKKKRFFLIFVTALLLIIIFLTLFYRDVQKDHFADMNRAAQLAREQMKLTTVTRVEPAFGDGAYHIVFGVNEEEVPLVIWVSDQDLHAEPALDAFTENQVREAVLGKEPNAQIQRILPNKIEGEYVWEAFYKKKTETGETKYFYDFYRFSDGAYIDTYRLSL